MITTTDVATDADTKMKAAVARQQKAQERLERQQKKVLKLRIEDELTRDEEYCKLAGMAVSLRDQLHRLRLSASRKTFAIRKRTEAIDAIQKKLGACKKAELILQIRLTATSNMQRLASERITKGLSRRAR